MFPQLLSRTAQRDDQDHRSQLQNAPPPPGSGPADCGLLRDEAEREATGLELIPSENLVSEAVLEAMGSVFTNKYAEGLSGQALLRRLRVRRQVEQLAIDRA
jgi:glycine hydroxymethyltransferase